MVAAAQLITSQRVAAVIVLAGLLLLILELVRRKHLMERYALLWLFAVVVLLVLVVWRGLLSTLAYKVGIHYPPSALFAVALGLGLILLVHFSLAISRLTDQNKVLAQRMGILQQRLDEQTPQRTTGAPGRTPAPTRASADAAPVEDEELSRAG